MILSNDLALDEAKRRFENIRVSMKTRQQPEY